MRTIDTVTDSHFVSHALIVGALSLLAIICFIFVCHLNVLEQRVDALEKHPVAASQVVWGAGNIRFYTDQESQILPNGSGLVLSASEYISFVIGRRR